MRQSEGRAQRPKTETFFLLFFGLRVKCLKMHPYIIRMTKYVEKPTCENVQLISF